MKLGRTGGSIHGPTPLCGMWGFDQLSFSVDVSAAFLPPLRMKALALPAMICDEGLGGHNGLGLDGSWADALRCNRAIGMRSLASLVVRRAFDPRRERPTKDIMSFRVVVSYRQKRRIAPISMLFPGRIRWQEDRCRCTGMHGSKPKKSRVSAYALLMLTQLLKGGGI